LAVLTVTLALAAGVPRAAHAADTLANAPAGQVWVHEDIGDPGAAGNATVTGTGTAALWTVSGSGGDIQGSADMFHFAHTPLTGDGGITARILKQTPGEPTWTKTGVMLRESNEAGARMIIIAFTSNAGLEGGMRLETDGGWSSPGANGVGRHDIPETGIWMRVQHKGNQFQILSSEDGKSWTLWGNQTIEMDLTKPLLAGLAVTSHQDGDLADATFDNVSVDNQLICPF
jgi:regulation of enolase protein 1 (concanavalin A-like superfamily)